MNSLLRFFKTHWTIFLIIILATALYINGIPNDFVNDDVAQVTENSTVQSINNIPQFFFNNIFYNDGKSQLGSLQNANVHIIDTEIKYL